MKTRTLVLSLGRAILFAGGFLLSAPLRADISITESIECLVDRSDVIAVYEAISIADPYHEKGYDRYEATLKLVNDLRGSGPQQITKIIYIGAEPYGFRHRVRRVGSGDQFMQFFASGDPLNRDPGKFFVAGNSIYLYNKERDRNFGLAVTADFRILSSKENILTTVKTRIKTGRQIRGTDRGALLNAIWPDKRRKRAALKNFVALQIPFGGKDWHYLTPSGIEFINNTKDLDILLIPSDLYYPYLREIDTLLSFPGRRHWL